ncbi:hypothetical protein MATL_G00155710 [Megalops atlanticus]|uniref:EF-hand domain-containing protein n=1 Tax=Megalops atlanticus TaxID=7932 RepID=A0A9D3PQ89_MEGAT|nr:hypothetical protein MATL_G00155710 [Megalops atlanticus]
MRGSPVPMRSRGVMGVALACALSLLLAQRSLSAPQGPGSDRTAAAAGGPFLTLANPFGSSEEERRLLQSYIRSNVKDGQANPDLNTWEQEIFFLFSLHDYDRSGQMDGLEVMKLLSDFQAHHSPAPQSADSVVSMVDALLQTQDLNQDGMLDPSELLTPPTDRRSAEAQPGAAGEANLSHDAPAEPAEETPPQHQPIEGAVAPQEAELSDSTGEQQQEGDLGLAQHEAPGEEPQQQDSRGEAAHQQPGQEQEGAEQQPAQGQEAAQQAQAPDPAEPQHHPVHQGQPEI